MSNPAPFRIDPYKSYDKSIIIHGPGDLILEVDYDDVNHDEVEQQVSEIVSALNRHWELNHP